MPSTERAPTRIWMQRLRADPDITKVRLATLLILGTYMDADGSNGRVRETTIAEAVGITDRAVREHLAYARDSGYLNRSARGHRLGDGTVSASTYEATVPITSTGTGVPVEDDVNRNLGAGRDEPQPEPGRISTGTWTVLNRNLDVAHIRNDQVLTKEQTTTSAGDPEPVAHGPLAEGGGGEALDLESDDESPDAIAVDAVLASVAERWGREPDVIAGHAGRIGAALDAGWPAPALAEHLAADPPQVIRSAARLLGRRFAELPPGPAACDCTGCTRWRRLVDAERRRTAEAERRDAARAANSAAVEDAARTADTNTAITTALGSELTGRLAAAALAGAGYPRNVRPMPGVVRGLLADVYARHGHDLEAIRTEAETLPAARESA